MGRKLRFFLGIVILSPLLFIPWELWLKDLYIALLKRMAAGVYHAGSGGPAVPVGVSSVVPLLVLLLATPGLGMVKRVRRAGYGLAILLPWHFLTVLFYSHWMANPTPSSATMYASLLVNAIQMALPLVLWAVFSRHEIRDLVSGEHSDRVSPS